MPISTALAAVAVSDLAQAREFYARLFDRPADVEPMPTLAQWDLQPAGGVQVVEDPGHSGSSMCTLLVTELDDVITELGARGITTDAVIDGSVSRVTQLTDPDGNTITLAELAARP